MVGLGTIPLLTFQGIHPDVARLVIPAAWLGRLWRAVNTQRSIGRRYHCTVPASIEFVQRGIGNLLYEYLSSWQHTHVYFRL